MKEFSAGRTTRYRIIATLVTILLLAILVEAAGRIFLFMCPSYEVVFLEPDRAVGWKHVPGLRWTWAGAYWYAADFSVPIESNSMGFRDLERAQTKTPSTVRIALLGDSLVEAIQVPLEKTAGQILENRLNANRMASSRPETHYEVLNFGISNYGVGQYLLVWEEYASKYDPDYVFVFFSDIQVRRTVRKRERGAFRATNELSLRIRPTFRLKDGILIREPAEDFEEFVSVQAALIRDEFGGKRSRVRETSVLGHYAKHLYSRIRKNGQQGIVDDVSGDPDRRKDVYQLNFKIIDVLHNAIRDRGGQLVVVDASSYFNQVSGRPTDALENLCDAKGIGYLPLYRRFLRAYQEGIPTRWDHDAHFNEKGNEIFADAMYAWLCAHSDTCQ